MDFYHDKGLPVELICGSSVSPEEFPPLSTFDAIEGGLPHREQWPTWYQQDLNAARSSSHSGVLARLVQQYGAFDLVYLDGGEFTSYAEFKQVRHCATYIVLDDCNPRLCVKNFRSRNALLHDSAWILLADEMNDRNGWCAFRKTQPTPVAPGQREASGSYR